MAVYKTLRCELAAASRVVFKVCRDIAPSMWPDMTRGLLSLHTTTVVDIYSLSEDGRSLLKALVYAFSKGWAGPHLLDYSGARADDAGHCVILTELMTRHCPSLRHLRLTNLQRMSSACLSHIGILGPTLTSLDLSMSSVGPSGANLIAEAFTLSRIGREGEEERRERDRKRSSVRASERAKERVKERESEREGMRECVSVYVLARALVCVILCESRTHVR